MADPASSEGFIARNEKMIADLRAELGPLEMGTSTAGRRPYGGEWEDITVFRIEQIKREIVALESSLVRHKASPP